MQRTVPSGTGSSVNAVLHSLVGSTQVRPTPYLSIYRLLHELQAYTNIGNLNLRVTITTLALASYRLRTRR